MEHDGTVLYLQTTEDRDLWEQVDEYIFQNWSKSLRPDHHPRYTGNKVIKTVKGFTIDAKDLTAKELAIVARYLGVKQNDCPDMKQGGFLRKPEFIRVRQPSSRSKDRVVLHEVFGETFHKAAVIPQRTDLPATINLDKDKNERPKEVLSRP